MAPTHPVWPTKAGMTAFYGNPDINGDRTLDPGFERDHITTIEPPYGMVWAFDTDADGKLDDPVTKIRVNKACAASLTGILEGIATLYGSQGAIEKARMHLFGGCFNFRAKRGSSGLSIHSWGAAIDLDPERNGFRQAYKPGWSIPMEVVAIAEAQGWIWGGRWSPSSCDPMHFQATASAF